MIRTGKAAALAGGVLALSACVSAPAPAPATTAAAPAPRVASVAPPVDLAGIIGAPASALSRRFGEPRIDMVEGDARKLQFASGACVLDIYLYPPAPGAARQASHVEARQRQGGAATDRRRCIAEVERAARRR
ncbi:hypothetical protein [Erythrobacter sp.]|jgi:hypothetical protein|uniref:hypothetical protein n=1 Tax=Erythrobacter sp. TaxID=1042 RepID=UPI002EA74AF9|nr:hypothetical protein [Erythrobacter sp.]